MFDQLATVSLAGTGLAITLIGSVLKDGSWQVWLSVIFFGIAAVTALTGNIRLIEGTFQRRSVPRRSRVDVSLAIMFIGAGAGFLSMDVYATRKSVSTHATSLPVKGD